MVVLDDEQDENESMDEIDTTATHARQTVAAPPAMIDMTLDVDPLPLPDTALDSAGAGGGFIASHDDIGAGFLPDTAGSGFMPEADDVSYHTGTGGGFMPDLSAFDGGGGFLPEPASAGGFLLDDVSAFSAGQGGGFVPEHQQDDTAMPDLPPLPALPPIPSTSATTAGPPTASKPKPQQPDRISLDKIPQALMQLDLPADSKDLMDLFREVASDDETVSRDRFFEACAALMPDDDDDDNDSSSTSSSQGYRDEERGTSDEDDVVNRKRRSKLKRSDGTAVSSTSRQQRSAPTPRRSTRANPAGDEEETAQAAIAKARTRDVDDDDEALFVDEDGRGDLDVGMGSSTNSKITLSKKGRAAAASGGSKGKFKLKQPRKLTADEMRDAEDTYELFFEGDGRTGHARDKILTLTDLQRVTKLLKKEMPEEDLHEMLEYAARDRGKVDLAAFTKVLAEAL
ncbi:hypothetical protein ACM66B_002328 [Microbotryomycetes sp. NB124-2]